MPQGKPVSSRLDAEAKRQGYPSYAAMMAYKKKYQSAITNVVPGANAKKKNVFQSILNAHPLNYTAQRVKKALGK